MSIPKIITIVPILRVPFPPSFIGLCQTLLKLSQLDILPDQLSMSYIRKLIMATETSTSVSLNTDTRRNLGSTEDKKTQRELGPNLHQIGYANFDISENIGTLADLKCWFIIFSRST
ncbi:hypothetical protein FGO68_gene286 [Halteria grandinella]|uniref:Uncharacterized protein n=1 Tax=Halteria grandinella TaxID=5974 RepID=A0A8J8NU50_HALGN|nr:hypothetical protein FGO68_gene286 [Halteria grandinella]